MAEGQRTCWVCGGMKPCGMGWFYCNGPCCDIYCVTAALEGPKAVEAVRAAISEKAFLEANDASMNEEGL